MRRLLVAAAAVVIVVVVVVAGAPRARAQPQLFRVYEYETPERRNFELSLWNTGVVDSSRSFAFFGVTRPTENAWQHALELEYGVGTNLVLGAYAVFGNADGGGFQFAEARLEGRYRFVQKNTWPIDLALYAEYYFRRPENGNDELELRVILEKDLGDFTLRANPIFEKETSGRDLTGMQFGYAVGAYYRRLRWFQPGVEWFGNVGELMHPHIADHQSHYVFGSLDTRLFRSTLWWHVAVGGGLTGASDELVVRSILSWQPTMRVAFRQR